MTPATDRSTLFVLLGAAGDLARRLVVPALFELFRGGAVSRRFRLLWLDPGEVDAPALAGRQRDGCEHFGRSGTPAEGQWGRFICNGCSWLAPRLPECRP